MRNFVAVGFFSRHHIARSYLAVAALAFALPIAGCGSLANSALLGPGPDQVLFEQGVEALGTTTAPDVFSRLATQFPESRWTARAKTIEKVLDQLKKEQHALGQREKQLEECQVEKSRLAGDVKSLEEYMARLKSLLAEAGIAEPVLPER